MNSDEKETTNYDQNNKDNMKEKVHYDIRFVETEDGFRLEANGDKELLRRMGFGPGIARRTMRRGKRRQAGRGPQDKRMMRRRAMRRKRQMLHQEEPATLRHGTPRGWHGSLRRRAEWAGDAPRPARHGRYGAQRRHRKWADEDPRPARPRHQYGAWRGEGSDIRSW